MRGSELIRIKVLYSPKPEINRRQRNFQSRIILLLQINSKISLYIHSFSFFRFLKFFSYKNSLNSTKQNFCWLIFLRIRYYTCSKKNMSGEDERPVLKRKKRLECCIEEIKKESHITWPKLTYFLSFSLRLH